MQNQGVKYACNHCDFQATQKGSLTKHIQSKHKGTKYVFDQCDFRAIEKGELTRHIPHSAGSPIVKIFMTRQVSYPIRTVLPV